MLNVDLIEMHMAETHGAAILATMLARVPLENSATIHKKHNRRSSKPGDKSINQSKPSHQARKADALASAHDTGYNLTPGKRFTNRTSGKGFTLGPK